ncbi:hypothetical protein DAMA08_011040 [Martiniozyma asiatica (nom. inval.)]|nr:hypothetical protein DAMA08_011040 [Martiniozyma asiatica]
MERTPLQSKSVNVLKRASPSKDSSPTKRQKSPTKKIPTANAAFTIFSDPPSLSPLKLSPSRQSTLLSIESDDNQENKREVSVDKENRLIATLRKSKKPLQDLNITDYPAFIQNSMTPLSKKEPLLSPWNPLGKVALSEATPPKGNRLKLVSSLSKPTNLERKLKSVDDCDLEERLLGPIVWNELIDGNNNSK